MSFGDFWLQSNNGKKYSLKNLKDIKPEDVAKNPKFKKLIEIFNWDSDGDGNISVKNTQGKNEWESVFADLQQAAVDNDLTSEEFGLHISKKLPNADLKLEDVNELLDAATQLAEEVIQTKNQSITDILTELGIVQPKMTDTELDKIKSDAYNTVLTSTISNEKLDKDYEDIHSFAKEKLSKSGKQPTLQEVILYSAELQLLNPDIKADKKIKKGTSINLPVKSIDKKKLQLLEAKGIKVEKDNYIFFQKLLELDDVKQATVLNAINNSKFKTKEEVINDVYDKTRINLADTGLIIKVGGVSSTIENFITNTLKVDLSSKEGLKIYDRLSRLDQKTLDNLPKDFITKISKMSNITFDKLADKAEVFGIILRTDDEIKEREKNSQEYRDLKARIYMANYAADNYYSTDNRPSSVTLSQNADKNLNFTQGAWWIRNARPIGYTANEEQKRDMTKAAQLRKLVQDADTLSNEEFAKKMSTIMEAERTVSVAALPGDLPTTHNAKDPSFKFDAKLAYTFMKQAQRAELAASVAKRLEPERKQKGQNNPYVAVQESTRVHNTQVELASIEYTVEQLDKNELEQLKKYVKSIKTKKELFLFAKQLHYKTNVLDNRIDTMIPKENQAEIAKLLEQKAKELGYAEPTRPNSISLDTFRNVFTKPIDKKVNYPKTNEKTIMETYEATKIKLLGSWDPVGEQIRIQEMEGTVGGVLDIATMILVTKGMGSMGAFVRIGNVGRNIGTATNVFKTANVASRFTKNAALINRLAKADKVLGGLWVNGAAGALHGSATMGGYGLLQGGVGMADNTIKNLLEGKEWSDGLGERFEQTLVMGYENAKFGLFAGYSGVLAQALGKGTVALGSKGIDKLFKTKYSKTVLDKVSSVVTTEGISGSEFFTKMQAASKAEGLVGFGYETGFFTLYHKMEEAGVDFNNEESLLSYIQNNLDEETKQSLGATYVSEGGNLAMFKIIGSLIQWVHIGKLSSSAAMEIQAKNNRALRNMNMRKVVENGKESFLVKFNENDKPIKVAPEQLMQLCEQKMFYSDIEDKVQKDGKFKLPNNQTVEYDKAKKVYRTVIDENNTVESATVEDLLTQVNQITFKNRIDEQLAKENKVELNDGIVLTKTGGKYQIEITLEDGSKVPVQSEDLNDVIMRAQFVKLVYDATKGTKEDKLEESQVDNPKSGFGEYRIPEFKTKSKNKFINECRQDYIKQLSMSENSHIIWDLKTEQIIEKDGSSTYVVTEINKDGKVIGQRKYSIIDNQIREIVELRLKTLDELSTNEREAARSAMKTHEKYSDTMQKCRENSNDANELYRKYISEQNVDSKTKEYCQKINQEFGIKVFFCNDIDGTSENLVKIYNLLSEITKRAESHGEKPNFPATIEPLTLHDYLTNKGGSADIENNRIFMKSLSWEDSVELFMHELTHFNDKKLLEEYPDNFDKAWAAKELQNSGVDEHFINYALNSNPCELLAVAMEKGNYSVYSQKFKQILIDFGLPEWMLDIDVNTTKKSKTALRKKFDIRNTTREMETSDVAVPTIPNGTIEQRLEQANDRESFVAIREEIKKLPQSEEKTRLMQAYLQKYNAWSADPSRPDIRMQYLPEAKESSFKLTEDNTVLTEKEIDTRLRDFGLNDKEISEIKTNIKNIDIIIKMFSFGKKLGIDLSDKKLLLESFYSYDQSPDLPKKSYFTEENYNELKKYVDVSELKPEETLMLMGFIMPNSFESIKKYTDLVGHKLSLDELNTCLNCTDKNGILYENALKLSKYPLAINDCKDKDGNFDDSMIDFTYELLEANSSENLKYVPNEIIKLCRDKNGHFIKENGDLISKYCQSMGVKLVSDGIQLANGKINEEILNSLFLKKDKHVGFIHIERSLKEYTDAGEYLVNSDAVELYFKWLDLGNNDSFDFEMLINKCKNNKGKFDKHSLEFAGELIDIATKRLETDDNPNVEHCNRHIEKILELINSGDGELKQEVSKAVLDAIPKVQEWICTEGMLNSIVDALDACISENGFSKGAFEKTMAIIFDDMYALNHLKHKENGGSKDVICEEAIDLYNALAEHDCLSSLFSFINFKKSNGEFDVAKLEAAIQLVDMIKPNEVGELSGFAAACVEDGKVNAEKVKTIKFIKTAKLSDLRNFVQKYADEYGYVDIFKLMPVVKKLGFGIDFANYIKIACYEPECVKYAEILKDNGYGYSEIGQLIDSIRQCVTNANPKTILTESDYVHLTKLASLRIKSDKLNTILHRCMNGFDSETLFSSEKLKTASDLIAEYSVLEDTFSNNTGRAHDTDIIMPVKTIAEKLKGQNVDKSIQNNILKAITNENIEFALEHIDSSAIPLEHLGNMLEVININNRDWNFIKKHIQDKDVPWEYLPQLIKRIRVTASYADPKYYDKEPSIIVAEDLIKNQRFSWEEKLDIQECVNGSNAALVKELSSNPDFPASVIKRILMAIDSNNYDMAEQLCKNYKKTEVPVETIPTLIENAEKISYKDVQRLIRKIGKAKVSKLTNNELIIAAQFVDVMGKTDINEISIAGKRKLLRDLVASNTGVFNISENLRKDFPLLPRDQESYCELLPAIVRSLGIETNILTTEQTVQFYQSQENLSAVLRDISDKDYAQLHITQEFSKDDFIEVVLSKVKDLSSEERQKVFDYFGFELHHNSKGTQGKYSITGYPVNLNNGHKLAMITDPKTKAVVENLRPDVIRFSEQNPIKCENKEVEKLLNEMAVAVPEIRTMIGKVQHGTHDFDLMKHTLKVMQKISQDLKFKQLSESDQKIMLLASLMHDISKGEGFSDHTHATEGSFDTFFIAKKFNLTKEEEIKLYTLIRHHEWLNYVNTAKTEAEQTKRLQSVAYDLQHDNLLDMAIIFTHADLRAVKADDSFHDRTDGASRRTITGTQRSFGESADVYVEKMKGLVKILQNSQPLLPVTPIPTASSMKARINKINEDGSTNIKGVYVDKDGLMLIKFNEVEDWEVLGFPKGTTSKGIMSPVMEGVETGNIKWFVHGLEYPNQLAKFDAFGLVNSDALLSVSYTERPESKYRFFRTQGVVLNVATKYVHGGGETDSGSGCGKSIQDFKNRYIFGGERESDRLFVSNLIKEATCMSDAEYVEFVRKNENKSFTEIEPVEYREKIIQAFATINSKTRRGERAYNEMYASNPEVMAVFAYSPTDKVGNVMDFYSSSSERLDFLKDFALKRDIPMIVFGN